MLHTITKQLEICIDINIEISEVNHYTWIFTSRIFRPALETTFSLNKYFSYKWLRGLENLLKKNKRRYAY